MEKNEPISNGRLPVVLVPGGISPAAATFDRPHSVAETIRPILKQMS